MIHKTKMLLSIFTLSFIIINSPNYLCAEKINDKIINNTITSNFDIIIPDQYPTIQDGINNSNPGDKIFVRSGIYYESIVINKEKILLQGENKFSTIIDIQNKPNDAVNITADNIVFQGFTVANARYTKVIWDQTGIKIYSSNITINDNIIIDNRLGILSYTFAFNLTISNNLFYYDGFFPSCYIPYSDSIPLESLNNNVINNTINGKPLVYILNEHNTIINGNAGEVILVNCTNVTVKNLYLKNVDFPVILYHCSNCYVEYSTIIDADGELILFFSENNTIQNNSLTNAFQAICLDIGSKNNIVKNNTIYDSLQGISVLTACTGNKIYKNKIQNSQWAMKITSYNENLPSHDNIVYDNIFSENEHAMVITTTNENPLCYTYNNTISNNTFLKNKKGILLISTEGNNITNNIFKKNKISAFFVNCQNNIWYHNYWNRGRFLPKIIFGYKTILNYIPIPWFNIDINPAKKNVLICDIK